MFSEDVSSKPPLESSCSGVPRRTIAKQSGLHGKGERSCTVNAYLEALGEGGYSLHLGSRRMNGGSIYWIYAESIRKTKRKYLVK